MAAASAPAPVPLSVARWILSLGMLASLAFCTARANAEFISGSPPPSRAATVIALDSLPKRAPRFASAAPFLRLIVDHFECPLKFRTPPVESTRGISHRPLTQDGKP